MADKKEKTGISESPDRGNQQFQEKPEVFPKYWLKLREACELKGLDPKTAQNKRHLQPQFGKEDGKIGGVRKWRWTTIQEWLDLSDEQIEEQLASK